jgi:hypothetical protein
MAWTYEQKFNGLNNGGLKGQDSWDGNHPDVFSVGTGVKYEGAKGVYHNVSSSGYYVFRTVSSVSEGSVYFAMRQTSNSKNGLNCRFRQSSGNKLAFRFGSTGNIEYQVSGGGYSTYSSYNANQWYIFNVEWDYSGQQDKFRLRVHDGTSWGSWTSWTTAPATFTAIDEILFIAYDYDYSVYFDTITPNDPTIAEFTPKIIMF